MSEEANATIKSVARVFQVLELFEKLREPLTSIRVGRSLDYPASSALALLKSMVALGYLSFDRIDRTYFPTMRLPLMSQWVESAVHSGDGSLIAMVGELIRATGESVSISCQNDLHMQFVHIEQGPQHITVNLSAGTLAPLFRSSIGLAALTMRPNDEILRLAARQNKASKGKEAALDPGATLELVEGIRRRGWFAGYDMYIEGVGAISWVLPTRDGRRNMVLAISGPTERIRRNEAQIVVAVTPILQAHGFASQERPKRSA
ncbi:helix-turn-helix domain-containing protein [Phenylobacterium sp.]|uniref:IclR family transcriptional regulator n=1 Tax=Phenylobacterium sp. TaxID=1871053 RepID=UPI0025ED7C9C|nr:helix-turn-helix domain-containing protein [Phenylobacterium sp.]